MVSLITKAVGKYAMSTPPTPSTTAAPIAGLSSTGREPFAINFVRPHPWQMLAKRTLSVIATGYLTANLVVALVLVISLIHLSRQRSAHRVAAPAAVMQEMRELQAQAKQQLAELTTIIADQQQQFPAAGKLAALANTLPARTWITGIESAREARTLRIRALYAIDPEQPFELPAKGWIDALRADPIFGQQLKQLSLEHTSRDSRGKLELFSFEIAAEWTR